MPSPECQAYIRPAGNLTTLESRLALAYMEYCLALDALAATVAALVVPVRWVSAVGILPYMRVLPVGMLAPFEMSAAGEVALVSCEVYISIVPESG